MCKVYYNRFVDAAALPFYKFCNVSLIVDSLKNVMRNDWCWMSIKDT